jgi:hypothetical protein
MIEETVMLRRAEDQDVETINAILNHPAVYPHATQGHDVGVLDIRGQMEAQNLHVLMIKDGEGGCIILDPYDDATLELHTCILPDFRGKAAEQVAAETLRFAFGDLGGLDLLTRVQISNRGADLFARQVGFVRISDEENPKDGIRSYQMTSDRWPYVDKNLHQFAPEKVRDLIDSPHFRQIMGAVTYMGSRDRLGHGVALYNKHARLHGYHRMDVVGPDSIMVGGLIIHFAERNKPRVEEALCQQQVQSQP